MSVERVLTAEAQADRDEFDRHARSRGCICFIAAPCGYCTHPGNPLNQEDDECWRDADEDDLCVTWEDYCRERDRINLPSGGFAKEVWQNCTLAARKDMMRQLYAMKDDEFDQPKAWGTW